MQYFRQITIIYLILLTYIVPAAETNDICFHNNYLPFFRNFRNYDDSVTNKLNALAIACNEIDWPKMNESSMIHYKAFTAYYKAVGVPVMGTAPAAFSQLKSTSEEKRYMAELNRIKSIDSPIERIRQTYELAARNSGNYDYDSNGMKSWASGLLFGTNRPENLLKNKTLNGTVGVCREFASLLQWSLMQVSRHSDSKNMALNKNDFSSEIILDAVPTSKDSDEIGGHAWVRINLPIFKNDQIVDFTHFDIDTTWYPGAFSPLFPRRSGVTSNTQERAKGECKEISKCLTNIGLKSQNTFNRHSSGGEGEFDPGAK